MPNYTFKQQLVLTIIIKGPAWGQVILAALRLWLICSGLQTLDVGDQFLRGLGDGLRGSAGLVSNDLDWRGHDLRHVCSQVDHGFEQTEHTRLE